MPVGGYPSYLPVGGTCIVNSDDVIDLFSRNLWQFFKYM